MTYRAAVVARTRHGWRKLHSFAWDEPTARWIPDTGWLVKKTTVAARDASFRDDGEFDPVLFQQLSQSRRYKADRRRYAQRNDALSDESKAFHLNTDAIVPQPILSVIFDVLRANGLGRVNIDDVKVIESKHGSQILGLGRLPDDRRQHATVLLRAAILTIVLQSDCQ